MQSELNTMSSYDVVRQIIGDKWKVLIICYLFEGPLRFGEILRLMEPISKKVLMENLRDLEALYIVTRDEIPGNVKNVTYSLTELGLSFQSILSEIFSWSLHYAEIYKQKNQK